MFFHFPRTTQPGLYLYGFQSCHLLQALEAALPPTVSDFMHLISAHAHAGQEHSFATCQLLQLAAACVVRHASTTPGMQCCRPELK